MELLAGKLQSNAAELDLYHTFVEDADENNISDFLDARAGPWDRVCVDEFFALTHECLAVYLK